MKDGYNETDMALGSIGFKKVYYLRTKAEGALSDLVEYMN